MAALLLLATPTMMTALRAHVLAAACLTTACSGNGSTTTAPSTTTTTATAVAPTVSEDFTGTVPVGGAMFYSFTVSQYGTVNVTLTSVSGAFVPATVMMGVGLGTPSGTSCDTTTSVTVAAGGSPQLTGAYSPGVYCAKVFDAGNLFAPASISASVAYP